MSDFGGTEPKTPTYISSYGSHFAIPESGVSFTKAPASGAWPGANQGQYLLFHIPWPYPVKRVFWGNGSAAGNMDVGIYTASFDKIFSIGPTAQTPASGLQFATVSGGPILLAPGKYYFAISNNGTTNRGWSNSVTNTLQAAAGNLQQASVATLPDPIVPVTSTTGQYELCGFSRV